MSVTSAKEESAPKRLLAEYLRLLRTYPIITKSLTSGTISAVSNIIAQKLVSGKDGQIAWRTIGAFATTGIFYTGPVTHFFYRWLERAVPGKDGSSKVLKVIVDRLVVAPPFLLGYFYCIKRIEGLNHNATLAFIKQTYWTVLKMNWKVWTIFQYINVNFVPIQYRVIFASAIAFFWTLYMATVSRR